MFTTYKENILKIINKWKIIKWKQVEVTTYPMNLPEEQNVVVENVPVWKSKEKNYP